MKVGCPSCGAEVEFRYDDSFVRVCGHCRSARENLCVAARFTGWDRDGGYAEACVVDDRRIASVNAPFRLPWRLEPGSHRVRVVTPDGALSEAVAFDVR